MARFLPFLASAAAAHDLQLSYVPDNGNMSITFDGAILVAGGLPHVYSMAWWNGSAPVDPGWVWFHQVNASFTSSPNPTYFRQYHWANISVTHVRRDALTVDMQLEVVNTSPYPLSGVTFMMLGDFNGPTTASALNFPRTPRDGLMACSGCWTECGDGVQCLSYFPQAIPMDWGTGAAAWVITDAPLPTTNVTVGLLNLYGWHLLADVSYLEVGGSVNATYSLRFGDGGGPNNDTAPPIALTADVLTAFAQQRPMTTRTLPMHPIGAMFGSNCGASCTCSSYDPSVCPNPRGWGSDIGSGINVTSPEGVAAFHEMARAWVNRSVNYCLNYMGPGVAQCSGILFWSLEGSQWTWDTYVGAPDMLATIAPEMDSVVDELLAMVTSAGLEVGMTLRPQLLTPTPDWNSSVPPNKSPQPYYQHDFYLPDNSSDVQSYAANIIRKATYAIQRWNASMFYVDTTGNKNGVLPHGLWDIVTTALPGIIFFPEESYSLHFSRTAPLQDNWGGSAIPVNPSVKLMWPKAYSLQLMQFDVTQESITPWIPIVQEGDPLLLQPWYNSTQNVWVKAVYEAAAAPAGERVPSVFTGTLGAIRVPSRIGGIYAAVGNSTYDYENPSPSGCNVGEIPAVVTGVTGQWCSPSCNSSFACSTNIPPVQPWITEPAAPQCMLQYPGDLEPTGCGLVCDPSAWGPCPPGASCQPVDTFGICTFPLPSQVEALPPHAQASAVVRTTDATPVRVHVTSSTSSVRLRLSALPWSARFIPVSILAPSCGVVHVIARMEELDVAASSDPSATTPTGIRTPRNLYVSVRTEGCTADDVDVVVQAPRDVLHASFALTEADAGIHARIAQCSDGIDNDGDHRIDYPVDAACTAAWDDHEGASMTPASAAGAAALTWTIVPHTGNGTGVDGARIAQLSYLPSGVGGASISVWLDEMDAGLSNATRWFLHDQSTPGSSMSITFTANGSDVFFQNGTPAKTLVASNATDASFLSTYPDGITVVDDISLQGSSMVITTTVMNGNSEEVLIGLPFNFGSLQLGRRTADGYVNASNSGIWRFDSKRVGSIYLGASQCGWAEHDTATDAYPTFGGFFSPLAGYGDVNMTFGVSTLDADMSPDVGHNFSVNYFQYALANRSPLLQQWHSMLVEPGANHTFTVVVMLGVPANVGVLDCNALTPPLPPDQRDIPTAMAVYKPYFDWFATVHGTTPTYCPTPASAWINSVGSDYNVSDHYYYRGTTLADVLKLNWSATALPPTGIPLYGVWSIALNSMHMTLNGQSYEFNPLIESIDPNMDAGCNHTKIGEVLSAFASEANVSTVYWFHRPCNDIVIPPNNTISAFLTCNADGTWNVTKGSFLGLGTLADLSTTYAQRQLARADYMISQGPKGYYLDSYFCTGGLRYVREMYRRHPAPNGVGEGLHIMPEGAIDTRSLISHQLPWLNIQSWNPALSDDFGTLVSTFLSMTSHYTGEIGPRWPPTEFSWTFKNRLLNGLFLTPFPTTNTTYCGWITTLYDNYAARMAAYGAGMGCPVYPAPTPTCG